MTKKKTQTKKQETLTQAALARALEVDPRAIRRWVDRGVVVPDAEGRFDLAAARAAIEGARIGTAGPGAGKRAAGPEDARLIHWRTKTERETFLRRRLERMELQGKLIRRSVVVAVWFEQATQVRDQLLQLGPRMADRLAAETDARICAQIVNDEVLTMLRSLSSEAPPMSSGQ